VSALLYRGTDTELSSFTSVLDLPQLYSEPSAESLLSALSQLAIAPSSFDIDNHKSSTAASLNEDGLPSYLTRIISNALAWIPSDSTKEEIWEAVSKRLSERSGRTAMPSVSRTFTISIPISMVRDDGLTSLEIKLHEPSLTGDNLGHKTWVASYLLAKRLPTLLPRHFPSITTWHNDGRPLILELGAGTGLVGLAASGLFSASISLTDLQPIVGNLRYNADKNKALTRHTMSPVWASELDWSDAAREMEQEREQKRKKRVEDEKEDDEESEDEDEYKNDIILAADSLYAPEHSGWLVRTMAAHLKRQPKSRIFVELPLRPGSNYPGEFRAKMGYAGFTLLEEGQDIGYDDWQTQSGEGQEVRCRWSVWAWGDLEDPFS